MSEDPEERAEGNDITMRFNSRLCIHARFCVTQAPDWAGASASAP